MKSFNDIEQLAYERHGGWEQIEKNITVPKSSQDIKEIADDRWLSAMSKCIFQAGFNWNIINDKWPSFEEKFHEFNVTYLAMQSDEDIDKLMKEDGIVKNYTKIKSVRENAFFLKELKEKHSSSGDYFSTWKVSHYVENLSFLQKNTNRLGGKTGQIFLRRMGVDTLIFTPDVIKALTQLNVLDGKIPTSKKSLFLLQTRLDSWHQESGYSLNKISQLLALSIN